MTQEIPPGIFIAITLKFLITIFLCWASVQKETVPEWRYLYGSRCSLCVFLRLILPWNQMPKSKVCIDNYMYGRPSVSWNFFFIVIFFALIAFHLKFHINPNTAHLLFISNKQKHGNQKKKQWKSHALKSHFTQSEHAKDDFFIRQTFALALFICTGEKSGLNLVKYIVKFGCNCNCEFCLATFVLWAEKCDQISKCDHTFPRVIQK